MNKKATLLITHIHKVYTAKEIQRHMIVYHDAYIGVYHDTILAIGCGDYHHLIDKDTRVIDAQGHIAVPGFIDCQLQLPLVPASDKARRYHETFMNAMQHGTVAAAAAMKKPAYFYAHYAYEVIWNPTVTREMPIIDMDRLCRTTKKAGRRFCIASGVHTDNLLLPATCLAIKEQIPFPILLKALTKYPAAYLGLHRLGTLAIGKQADILLINALDLKEMFSTLHEDKIYQVIKKGVRIYPNVIV